MSPLPAASPLACWVSDGAEWCGDSQNGEVGSSLPAPRTQFHIVDWLVPIPAATIAKVWPAYWVCPEKVRAGAGKDMMGGGRGDGCLRGSGLDRSSPKVGSLVGEIDGCHATR